MCLCLTVVLTCKLRANNGVYTNCDNGVCVCVLYKGGLGDDGESGSSEQRRKRRRERKKPLALLDDDQLLSTESLRVSH